MKNSPNLENKLSEFLPRPNVENALVLVKYFIKENQKKKPKGYKGVPYKKLKRDIVYKNKKLDETDFELTFSMLRGKSIIIESKRHYDLSSYYRNHYGKVN